MAETTFSYKQVKPIKKSIRLTFRIADGKIEMISHQRLIMTCPPAIGDPPDMDRHEGLWLELRDQKDRRIFHRVINPALINSVEVFSPDGKIERVFGKPEEVIFEVIVPDTGKDNQVVFIGDSFKPSTAKRKRKRTMKELVRIDIPSSDRK